MIPEEVQQTVSDVETPQPVVAEEPKANENLADKTLAELSEMFQALKADADSMLRSKEAENIKSAFYKLLGKLKGENPEAESSLSNPFEAVEENFKAMYADYKKERAEFNRQQEAQREENLVAKKQIIDELKALVEKDEDASASFPAFRELQNRWRNAGPVPVNAYRDINDILLEADRELVKGAFQGAHFEEYFFADCKDEKLAIKNLQITRMGGEESQAYNAVLQLNPNQRKIRHDVLLLKIREISGVVYAEVPDESFE